MVYYIKDGKKISISNFKNMNKRCNCDTDYYSEIANPIQVVLKKGKEPILFKSSTNDPYSNTEYLSRAVSFRGCACELDIISENYIIYGSIRPTQYNFVISKVNKGTGKCYITGGHVSYQQESKWAGR